MQQYPVLEIVDALKKALLSSSVVILQAPPGAGKSTVLPLHLMDLPFLQGKKTIMLEPRRLAARSVAERLADLLGEPTGQQIGYRVRFDTKVGKLTRTEVVTEGILTRMLQQDNELSEAGLLIFDEFHERSLHADLALALSLQVQHVLRPDLRILIMSATLDTGFLTRLFPDAPVIISEGRQFPVEIQYAAQEPGPPLYKSFASLVRRAFAEGEGDVLVFLPGAGEIRRVQETLEAELSSAVVVPLYGDLPFQKQQEAILPRRDGLRKIVLATSIAETSLTIEGVKTVVDCGLSRVPRFDPRSGLTRLETIRVTRDSADQRAGRAGRLSPGKCFRLWTQGQHLSLIDQRKPEILEADLAPLVLELYQWGVKNVYSLTWVTSPPPGAVQQAVSLLTSLEAIDDKGITERGKKMLTLPTHPRLSHLLLEARELSERGAGHLLSLAADLTALLEERDPLGKDAGADISLRIEVLRKWRNGERVNAERQVLERIEKLAANWRRILGVDTDNRMPAEEDIGKLVRAAYPERVAQQQGKNSNRYKLLNGRMAELAQHDALAREPLICVAHLDAGSGEGRIFYAVKADYDDLLRHSVESLSMRWDDEREMVVAAREKKIGALLLESRAQAASDEKLRTGVWIKTIQDKGLRIFDQEETRAAFQARVCSLHYWRKEEAWPLLNDEWLLANTEQWLVPFLGAITRRQELQKLDIHAMLNSALPWDLQQRIDILAPSKIQVPSGSHIKVVYDPSGSPPVMEVRLQEVFGWVETPAVNEGRTKVLLHLLSPGYKPVQVTQDLRSFWHTTYHEVRKELRMRYPRHHWPEDPWTAEAVRGAKKRRPD